jgi:hypothetical protein
MTKLVIRLTCLITMLVGSLAVSGTALASASQLRLTVRHTAVTNGGIPRASTPRGGISCVTAHHPGNRRRSRFPFRWRVKGWT